MTDPEQIPALFIAQAQLLKEWAEALRRHGHRNDVRLRIEFQIREMSANLHAAATAPENKPEEAPPPEDAESAH